MPKVQAPLFGFDAHGSLAGSLTYRQAPSATVAGQVPTHPDVATYAQRHRRFLYGIGLALWLATTPAQKSVWRAAAAGKPWTGMNAFLQDWLTTTPNLQLAWPLEEGQGGSARDHSPNALTGTIVGPSWNTLQAHPFLTFDGLDDYVNAGLAAALNFTTSPFSIIIRARSRATTGSRFLAGNYVANTSGYITFWWFGGNLNVQTHQAGANQTSQNLDGSLVVNVWHTLAVSRSGASVRVYLNGLDNTPVAGVHINPVSATQPWRLGFRAAQAFPAFQGDVACALLFNRSLTAAEHLAVHQRLIRLKGY